MRDFFEISSQIFIFYFASANFIFFLLLVVSYFSIKRIIRISPLIDSMRDRYDLIAPGISVIAPAFNEERSITQSVKSFLMLDYPNFEVVVVNDGSEDNTLQNLIDQFELIPSDRFYDERLSESKVRGFYRSGIFPNLFVVDKENGGKADAINVGISYAEHELFCAVDSDSILEPDCLLRVVIPFLEEPESTIAAGGTVRPVNGCRVEFGRVTRMRFPKKALELVQIIEYLRAFLFGRQGWNVLNATLIISGAFGIFKKNLVIEAGGYKQHSLGEDMELVVRLRKVAQSKGLPYRISFVPDPICWTEVPNTWSGLAKQRDRWQRGLAESLLGHMKIFCNPRFGAAGLIAFPYFFFVELLGPVIEVLAYVLVGAGVALGYLSLETLILLIIVDLVFGIFMSLSAVFIEENAFHKYSRFHQLFVLIGITFLEHLGFKQAVGLIRLHGLFNYLTGKSSWGKADRAGFSGDINA